MGTRFAAMAFLDDQQPVGPVHRSIIAVDLEGSTMRTNPVKGELRRVMYDLLLRSLEAVAITGDRLEQLADRGDGVLVLIRPHDDTPKTVLLDRLMPLLTALLIEHNAQAVRPALRMRLRAVLHAGEVHADGRGFYGEAIDVAIRLLDSPTVKRELRQTTAPLVLVISDEIHSGIVRHGYVDPEAYLPLVRVSVADRRRRGWVHIPVPPTG
jgi:class 3 adenylate cyclase